MVKWEKYARFFIATAAIRNEWKYRDGDGGFVVN